MATTKKATELPDRHNPDKNPGAGFKWVPWKSGNFKGIWQRVATVETTTAPATAAGEHHDGAATSSPAELPRVQPEPTEADIAPAPAAKSATEETKDEKGKAEKPKRSPWVTVLQVLGFVLLVPAALLVLVGMLRALAERVKRNGHTLAAAAVVAGCALSAPDADALQSVRVVESRATLLTSRPSGECAAVTDTSPPSLLCKVGSSWQTIADNTPTEFPGVTLQATPPTSTDTGSAWISGAMRADDVTTDDIKPAGVSVGYGPDLDVSAGDSIAAGVYGGNLNLSAGTASEGQGAVNLSGDSINFDMRGAGASLAKGLDGFILRPDAVATGSGTALRVSGGSSADGGAAGGTLTLAGGSSPMGDGYINMESPTLFPYAPHLVSESLAGYTTGMTIPAGRGVGVLDTASPVTMTSTPTVATPTNLGGAGSMPMLVLINSGAGTVTFQGEGTLPGSNLKLGAATRAVASGGSLTLLWDGSDWREIAFTASGS